MIIPRFVFPWALLLLAMAPWSIWLGTRIRSLSPGRKWTAITLRAVILILLVGALAGAEIVKQSDKLAVFFLLDWSDSIREEQRLQAAQWVRNVGDQFMGGDDEAGVIVFGEEASIEASVEPRMDLDDITSYVGEEQTDLAGAIRLAMAAFPQGHMKRIVVYSDGNETVGSALEEVKLARAAGVEVSAVPIRTEGGPEVRIKEVSSPNRANAEEPFQLRVVVHADEDGEATLRLLQRMGQETAMLDPQRVTLQKGDNTFVLTQEVQRSGFIEFEARVEADGDSVVANNEGRAFTYVSGEPVVLYVEADPEHSVYLEPALRAEGLEVRRITPAELPASLASLQNYDAIVLSNVSSIDLSMDHLNSLEAAVRDLAVGLVMIGGPESFGAGGYLDTPVEKALPVDMDLKQRKIMPKGALVIVLHTMEIQDGNVWAREIGLASLNTLSSQDLMGALGYMAGQNQFGDSWIFPLQPKRDGQFMRQALIQGSTNIGDMPAVGPTLNMAYQALASSDASVKRVVLISDGDPAAPPRNLLNQLRTAKIPVSTVCIAPHSPNDQNMLRWVAESTGGQFYFVNNANNLPLIFSKEASVVKRSLLIEQAFVPEANHDSELLYGLGETALPELLGYVVTSAKDNATVPLVSHEGDPVLAHWRYGLGKSVAFTSDVTNRWAVEWLSWEGFSRFWAQSVRWATREISPSSFRVETRVRDGQGYVRVDAVDEEGNFINYLRPRGVVTGPGPDYGRINLDLMQSGPGIYEGRFPVNREGVYMVNMLYNREDGTQGMIPAGLAMGYSREYEYNATNYPLLERISEVGGGQVMAPGDNPFAHDLTASAAVTPIWRILALIAACLFPVEIFVRRVVVDWRALYAPVAAGLRRVPGLQRVVPRPAPRPQAVTGTYHRAAAREHRFEETGQEPRPTFGVTRQKTSEAESEREEREPEVEHVETTGQTVYTQQLLAAKERALAAKKRRDESTTDGEES